MMEQQILIHTEFIRLDALLKRAGLADKYVPRGDANCGPATVSAIRPAEKPLWWRVNKTAW